MQKRGWIPTESDPLAIERSILKFYNIETLNEEPRIHGDMRKSSPNTPATSAQTAWAFRARKLATAIPSASVGRYDESRFAECEKELRKLAAYSTEVRKLPALLMSHGIRFVVVEGLSGAKVDG